MPFQKTTLDNLPDRMAKKSVQFDDFKRDVIDMLRIYNQVNYKRLAENYHVQWRTAQAWADLICTEQLAKRL